jgi:large subunit ribosomal protein L23Ae
MWDAFAEQVFITDVRASKKQIKAAVSRLYDIQTKRINTLIRSEAHAIAATRDD